MSSGKARPGQAAQRDAVGRLKERQIAAILGQSVAYAPDAPEGRPANSA